MTILPQSPAYISSNAYTFYLQTWNMISTHVYLQMDLRMHESRARYLGFEK
jgi:hypothetical protein